MFELGRRSLPLAPGQGNAEEVWAPLGLHQSEASWDRARSAARKGRELREEAWRSGQAQAHARTRYQQDLLKVWTLAEQSDLERPSLRLCKPRVQTRRRTRPQRSEEQLFRSDRRRPSSSVGRPLGLTPPGPFRGVGCPPLPQRDSDALFRTFRPVYVCARGEDQS